MIEVVSNTFSISSGEIQLPIFAIPAGTANLPGA